MTARFWLFIRSVGLILAWTLALLVLLVLAIAHQSAKSEPRGYRGRHS